MIAIELINSERFEFQYILPGTGSIETLKLVDSILKKIRIDIEIGNEQKVVIDFEDPEIDLLIKMIDILDKELSLRLSSLPLILKILNTKEKL